MQCQQDLKSAAGVSGAGSGDRTGVTEVKPGGVSQCVGASQVTEFGIALQAEETDKGQSKNLIQRGIEAGRRRWSEKPGRRAGAWSRKLTYELG